jgi:hypothetical protein
MAQDDAVECNEEELNDSESDWILESVQDDLARV